MNLGIYLKNMTVKHETEFAASIVNYGLSNNLLDDASIFYDNIGPIPQNVLCGLFNSTDLWNFNGTLITPSLDCIRTSLKIVNNFKLIYLHGMEKINILNLFDLLPKISILSLSEKANIDLQRLTGNYACNLGFVNTNKELLEKLVAYE